MAQTSKLGRGRLLLVQFGVCVVGGEEYVYNAFFLSNLNTCIKVAQKGETKRCRSTHGHFTWSAVLCKGTATNNTQPADTIQCALDNDLSRCLSLDAISIPLES